MRVQNPPTPPFPPLLQSHATQGIAPSNRLGVRRGTPGGYAGVRRGTPGYVITSGTSIAPCQLEKAT
jgi:hypothetical protein